MAMRLAAKRRTITRREVNRGWRRGMAGLFMGTWVRGYG
jgi:hypothetical protein